MNWIKNAIVDIVVTALIIYSVFNNITWLNYLIYAYTGIMLLMKVMSYNNETLTRQVKKTADAVPDWFMHVLYAINLGVLAGFQRWYLALGWGAIWLLSYLIQQRIQKAKKNTGSKKSAKKQKKGKR